MQYVERKQEQHGKIDQTLICLLAAYLQSNANMDYTEQGGWQIFPKEKGK